jgi:hypothetical protein
MTRVPSEGDLEGVLDGEGSTLDEEQVRELGVAEDAAEGLHEVREIRRLEIRIRRLVGGDFRQSGHEGGIVGEAASVEPERRRGEERVEVQVLGTVAGIDDPRAVARSRIEHHRVAVEEEMAAEDLMDVAGGDQPIPVGAFGEDGAFIQAPATTLSEGS